MLFFSPFNTNVVDDGKSLLYILNIKYIYICEKEMIYSFLFRADIRIMLTMAMHAIS